VQAVSNEAVVEHLPRVERWARVFQNEYAEFDDLVQEGWLKVFELIRDGKPVSNTAIKNAMRNWVRVCRRRGFADGEVPDPELLN
jgi:DNA-directed RNA polymerase specialized sigma24 family protein